MTTFIRTVVAVEPIDEPVTTAEMRDHLRLEIDADDAYLTQLISAARVHAENLTHRKFINTTVIGILPKFPTKEIILPFGKATSVTSIAYVDSNGAAQSLSGSASPAVFQQDLTDDENPVLWPLKGTDWPAVDEENIAPITITWVAGYSDDPEDLPWSLRHAIKLQAAKWFEAAWDAEAPKVVDPLFMNAIAPYMLIRHAA